jgi:hypothetical protein
MSDTTASSKHPRPKIMLVDLGEEEAHVLSEAGYRVERGTFGPVLDVGQQPGFLPLPNCGDLPNYREQEILIVDCTPPRPAEHDLGDPPPGQKWLWQHAGQGWLDPRPWAMLKFKEGLDRIYAHGGVVICFAAPKFVHDYAFVETEWEAEHHQGQEQLTTWEFLSVLAQVEVTQDRGEEITAESITERLPGFKSALEAASFTATLDASYPLNDRWVPLAKNKYGQTVAALVAPEDDTKQGVMFLLPRVSSRAEFLKRLVEETLPRFAPDLFPHIQQGEWTKQPLYELPGVAEIRAEAAKVEEEAQAKVAALEAKIEERREEHGFLHDLLTKDDNELVAAVKKTLELLGFNDVRDVDAETEDKKALREDLQIWDREPTLIAEVKGIGGLPREADALQVTKYVAPRMKEWKREAQGLTIINHQMQVEGLQRQADKVFQDDVVTNAEEHEFGLLTTWTLFRLARAYLRYGWQPEQVADLFYKHGVIEAVPAHYELVGTVSQFFEQASALTIDLNAEIKVGDTLAYELPVEFEQEQVQSLRLNDEAVEHAGSGVEVGVKTNLSKQQARKGVRVFKVI